MANVELVIKIDEEYIKQIDRIRFLIGGIEDRSLQINVINAIKNGMPLPKGHGRIADMDAAIKCIEEVEGEDAVWAIGLIEWACSKRTIIEADSNS